MTPRRALALLVLAVGLAGCASSASPAVPAASATSSSQAPAPSFSTPMPPTPGAATELPTVVAASPGTTPVASVTAAPFSLTAAAFPADGVIPSRFTCDGRDRSPAMAFTGIPPGTQSLALLVDDRDAHGFVHWIVYAVDPSTTGLAEGAGVPGSQLAQGTNDFGKVGWGGPCPPSGTHHYVFTLYALAAPLGLSGRPSGSQVRAALATADVLGKASLTAAYTRGG